MILVPLTFRSKQEKMQTQKQAGSNEEKGNRNKEDLHDPLPAGREAIEARKVNERDKPARQQEEEETKDAEQWRNEG